ncbi:hypothetical protein ACFROC_31590 [Nocardia tengchongensis]|uniref:hypothetical protein n=1 Tax=Nocardia tengchongensis TaxID=2055889 RepID=UPI0036A13C69
MPHVALTEPASAARRKINGPLASRAADQPPQFRLLPSSVHSRYRVMIMLMTEWHLDVSLAELRRSFNLLLDHVEATTEGDIIRLDEDYFWSIPQDELYAVDSVPSNLTMGQLSWSWQHLTDLLADPDQAIGYHLVWLAEVLRAIGQKTH